MIKKSFVCALCFIMGNLFGQSTALYTTSDRDFREATEIYQNHAYQFAQDRYQAIAADSEKPQSIRQISRFYALLCAIKLEEKGAVSRFEAFANSHAGKPYIQEAYQDLGDYFYRKSDYKNASNYYNKADETDYNNSDLAFRVGYAAFTQREYEIALSAFNQVDRLSDFFNDAQYFSGHILYQQGKTGQAKKIFTRLKYIDKYKSRVLPYLLQTAYKSADYAQAIEEGKKILSTTIRSGQSEKETQKLIGESYFNKEKYNEAIPYLEKYALSTKELTAADYYRLGFSYQQVGKVEKAIENYNKIVAGNDAIAQKAYYQLGYSYIDAGQKNEALNAFNSSAELSFDPKIKEDAFYNEAKLSYEIGSARKSAAEVISDYMVAYPESSHKEELEGLLMNYYENLEHFADAYQTLKTKLVKINPALKKMQAEIGYKYGTQLFKNENYKAAAQVFTEVSDLELKTPYTDRARYWLAQSDYQLGLYQKALKELEQIENQKEKIEEARRIYYNKGYLYFNLGNYIKAIASFKKFIAQTKEVSYKQDAQLRLADSYYAAGQFWLSLDEYQKAIDEKSPQEDYAAFQMGMIYGLIDQQLKKERQLLAFLDKYPQSEYVDDAMYQLASTYFKLGKAEKAIRLFSRMQETFPQSHLVGPAALKKAQIYYNNHQSKRALTSYKNIVRTFPNTSVAQEAALGVKKIYTESGQISEYEKWITQTGISLDENELSRLAYEAAEKQYNKQNFSKAITLLSYFVMKYPQSVNRTKAEYYQAESLYKLHKDDKAIVLFEKVKQFPAYAAQSHLRLAQIYLKQENQSKALDALLELSKLSSNQAYQNFAQVGIMRIYHLNNDDKKAFAYAENVLKSSLASTSAKEDAKLIVARNLIKSAPEKALRYYRELSKVKKASVKAEALYYMARQRSMEKHYKKSNDLIFDLTSNYTQEKQWVVQSLLIMADNYVALKDPYQANYTLETLINTYPQMTKFVEKAKERQKLIKK